ncbi:hypothetical protein FJV41_08140 [Myxococcus llanfairpwllgwyngyllgogerychwyrndrobwllllantysiliogogogochensis]|uniref:Uncharacterized protein n=1 Tax=Myxococcus llanfairpwllgwyngyllgogerychwyrndrobwllllantysiliogogogochensis TaxID=2590453 RepID=A0A540X5C9_9BACT|nr:hypothetical protein [Myxococcus llanfairpwllgwyngyllgogerychwyrndrobwllllantysiliogogogochensis]TQF16443.1 hypothetical protein FJV41_08140 [Myxococcus llanfairpwllgwyngyllgogerychwyrndrobwllllantysiliogogogochensis]
MTRRTMSSRWKRIALAAPVLAALAAPTAGLARDPQQNTAEQERLEIDLDRTGNLAGNVPPLNVGGMIGADVTPTQGMTRIVQGPDVDLTPDPKRTRQIEGDVVALEGSVLYVQPDEGAVVPLSLEALRLKQTPKEGRRVIADYQVENETQNMATALAGEKK